MEQNPDLFSFFFLISSSSSEAKPFPDTGGGEAGVLRARAIFQWGGSISVILLLILTRAKQSSRTKASLLVCCLLASLPTILFNILRGEFGYWVAFLSFAAHHFFPQEFPVSGFLLFVVAPSWVAHELHESILGGILCLVIGVSLLINEIREALNSNGFDSAWYWAYSRHSGNDKIEKPVASAIISSSFQGEESDRGGARKEKKKMNSICVATGCLDVQTPVKISFKNLYQWPESEAEFLNKLIITMNEENSPSTAAAVSPCFSHQKPSSSIDHHESFVCRQRYLRSYTFSKQKETVTEKTKRWIKEKKRKKQNRNNIHDHHHEDEKSSIGGSGGSSTNPCSSFKSAFLFLLSCMVSVDVHDT